MRPAAQHVLPVDLDIARIQLLETAGIKITLQSNPVLRPKFRIEPKTALRDLSLVFGVVEFHWQSIIALVHRVDPEKRVVVNFPAVAQAAEALLLDTAAAI